MCMLQLPWRYTCSSSGDAKVKSPVVVSCVGGTVRVGVPACWEFIDLMRVDVSASAGPCGATGRQL